MIKVPFGRPDITNQEIKAVVKVLKNPILAHGPLSHKFEKLFDKKDMACVNVLSTKMSVTV